MKPERWQRVKDLFLEVLEQPEEQRKLFLEQACYGDEDLQKEVVRILASHEEAAGSQFFVDAPVFSKHLLTKREDPSSLIGRRMGAYRLVREIGETNQLTGSKSGTTSRGSTRVVIEPVRT